MYYMKNAETFNMQINNIPGVLSHAIKICVTFNTQKSYDVL